MLARLALPTCLTFPLWTLVFCCTYPGEGDKRGAPLRRYDPPLLACSSFALHCCAGMWNCHLLRILSSGSDPPRHRLFPDLSSPPQFKMFVISHDHLFIPTLLCTPACYATTRHAASPITNNVPPKSGMPSLSFPPCQTPAFYAANCHASPCTIFLGTISCHIPSL